MEEFLHIALSFPTVVFSAMLSVMVLYWLLVILGAVDLELLDFDLDLDLDGDVDVDMELDVDVDVDAETTSGLEAGPGLGEAVLGALGLGTVPVTIIASFWTLAAWMISFAAVYYLGPVFGAITALVAVAIGTGAVLSALPVTMLAMQPLIGFFGTQEGPRAGGALVGKMCEVTIGAEQGGVGQARIADGGAGVVVLVRSDGAGGLSAGSEALVIDYDAEAHVYMVESYEDLMGEGDDDQAVVFGEQVAAAEVAAAGKPKAED